jgi:hypothetical protein
MGSRRPAFLNEDTMNRTRVRRWWMACAALLALAAPRLVSGQAPLVEHRLVFDMALSLPPGWALDSIPGLAALAARLYEWAPALTEERVQQLVADFQRTPLLRARNTRRLTDQAIATFTPLPGFQLQAFESGTPEQYATFASSHCAPIRMLVERAGGTVDCDRHEVRVIDGRKAVVILGSMRVDASGIDNRRTAVLMPIEGGLLTFTFSVHRTEADTLLAERIIATLRGPTR